MKITYKDSAIAVTAPIYERTAYDVSNNRITCGFDGSANITRYAVMNKFSVFSSFYSQFLINGEHINYTSEKNVTMIGRKCVSNLTLNAANITFTQFLDNGSNAVFTEISVKANEDIEFETVINFGIDYKSYLEQLFGSRLSFKNLSRIVGGFIFPKKKRLLSENGINAVRNNIFGDYYLDIASNVTVTPLEAERNFYNQYRLSCKIKSGEICSLRYVISAGTRTDFTYCDVISAVSDFDRAYSECEDYINFLKKSTPVSVKSEDMRAYYVSLLNCSLSNYKELGKFKGFLAGIVYQFPARTYYRDAYWTVLAALPVKPEYVRNEIITLAAGINKRNGECPSAVKFNFKNYWGNHYDSPSFLAILAYDYIRFTGDAGVLDEKCPSGNVFDAVLKAITRLSRYADETGLIVKSGEYNRRDWCDNVFRTGYVTYDEALYARALFSVAKLAELRGNDLLKKKYLTEYERVKKAINEILWDAEKGYFVNYKDGSFTEDNLSIDTVLIPLFGLTDKERSVSVLTNMEKTLESRNNDGGLKADYGTMCVYPFYKKSGAAVQKSSLPFYYHNGGDWPYLSCIYAYTKKIYGLNWEYPLKRWFFYNTEKGNFTPVEFFSPAHPDGSLLQAWSSTGAFALSFADCDFYSEKENNLNYLGEEEYE